ncbi:uncharacterized protein STEHIDRAFT_132528 [Stereum hirsutum FP-91666 SS1]|uniref:uncharacterized protein n=1 Tax=Stereum hirsutum (strain FP-91666) TaxID=721885 RepID=UPI0004449DCD|nr:uncharacterized protein STEHIDRAFT_132528 [Stereum hirsutum FP-91666 SS1]EIM85048.1 hypothetical protein STEHIDRAFT_132528 [Stereum hirsutum FP-91666 SS1]
MTHPKFVDDPEKGTVDIVLPTEPKPTHVAINARLTVVNDINEKTVTEVSLLPPVPPQKIERKPPQKKRAPFKVRAALWFNTYRKFFAFVTSLNLVGLVLASTGVWQYPRRYTGAFVLGNLLFAILMYDRTPLWFRLGCTSALQHLGGIHSGCATSGFAWLIFRVVLIFIDHKDVHNSILITGVITNLAVSISIASAFPWVRNTHHNVFERHHRFIGWVGLLSTWIFVVLGDSYDLDTHTWNPSGRVLRQQDFWFAFGMTVFIMIPWFTVREVAVDIEVPSPKVAILRFERGMQQGLLARISRSSIMEYHAFGIISEGRHAKYHYLICGVQGDFTRSLVTNPPTHVWTRQLKFPGVSNTSKLYKRGIRVCTGTGLGAALSTCLQSKDWYLIWIGSEQEKTFGPTISGLIKKGIEPERMTLWDSKQRGGRPDVMKLVKDAYKSFNAEVVFITSNYQGNADLMEGCKQAGIPAFGTLWDF